MSLVGTLRKMSFMLAHGQYQMITGRLAYRLYSNHRSFGLRRDMHAPFSLPQAGIDLTIRPIEEKDVSFIFNTEVEGISPHDRVEVMARLLLLHSKIPTCYVAVANDGHACFAGWLFLPSERERVREYFKNGFPQLREDEALFEFAYTHPAYRGNHIMPWAMASIAERAKDHGARWVLAFADHRNDSSLRRCRLAGFEPYLVRKEGCRLFVRTVKFEPLSNGDLEGALA